ncbi:hypothetical protein CO051_00400 [Candidatus Roizmanbacteria bacterium CG_4_9_14_0_2_um_filter_39_13]|uniref:Sodium/calcium exchanger membrane region domain-containing protein n=2 Tax=Candidatus Roizmaniibacteriota TaxID=1752723 RepID=A0A2M8F479_9BACT|nr:MAG: hypothetical protein CO051_00400 [Candidatus Roizmanbacteria bacterium CG_4_9_14_0_2_um_filter_39_13]PJE61524.1 MAG: hypothetical protein COU87_04145 [Candidatus Roizmanbacteria bacterium CG10_big_fil_rev_8_21_14_0_10_39_12]
MLYLSIAGIIIFSLVLIKAAGILAVHLKALAIKTHLGGFFISAFIIGLATSLPELFVGITSALNGVPNISLGNAIGSNIANMTLVAGGAALLAGNLKIRNHSYASDLLHAFIAGMAPLYLLMDNSLSRVDALILIALYFFYNYAILKKRNKEAHEDKSGVISTLFRRITHSNSRKDFMYIFLSIAAILFSADMIVRIGMDVAVGLNISVLLVGLFFVAIGTSLPEFVVEFQAIRKQDAPLYMGNLLGSIVANGTLIVGITALISPIHIQAFNDYLVATLAFLVIFFVFYFFIRTKEMINRFEGFVLISIYAVFVLIEFLR